MGREKSIAAFEEAQKYIPGGVNSPVRALRSVGATPLFIRKAEGVTLTDIDDNQYTDFCLSWGVFIAGHANPSVQQAVIGAIPNGTSYGIPTLLETQLAKRVSDLIPSMEQVRFVNSGTEATMSAIRLARGYTKRDYIIKFEGCYHGHADHLLVSAGSGVATCGISSSAGVPQDFAKYTLVAPFNDKEAVREIFRQHKNEIAAIIVEPVPANMGVVPQQEDFLRFLREITLENQSLLIFDEVITGFRLTLGGAQKYYGISPDLTTVGKIVGGGFPAAAFGGRKEIMQLLAPLGPVYQAGTLSGNPIAMTAGLATLAILSQPNIYEDLNAKAEKFIKELAAILRPKGVVINHVGNMFTPFFTNGVGLQNFSDVKKSDTAAFARFFRYMLSHGVYISPSQFEGNFISIQHTEEKLAEVLEIAKGFEG
ncbi:MAG: glutamate-1-semialdehyde 2,1-aminomutase [Bacteroidales bacterium]|nr:glutamate-1-semialdehyde 2,1-aminomutase [Candidatus Physcocola equi]